MRKIQASDLPQLLRERKVIFTVFSSPSCTHCKQLQRVIDVNVKPYVSSDVDFVEIDVVENSSFAHEKSVMSLPTLMVYHNGAMTPFRGKDKQGKDVIEDRLIGSPPHIDKILIAIAQMLAPRHA